MASTCREMSCGGSSQLTRLVITACASVATLGCFLGVIARWAPEAASGPAPRREASLHRRGAPLWMTFNRTASESPPRRLGRPSACQAIQVELHQCDGGPCDKVLPSPLSCAWSDWSEWSACSCGGSHRRDRSIAIPGGFGGMPCQGSSTQAQPCSASDCVLKKAVDCQLGSWTDWSDCTKSCQGGQQSHTREIIRQQNGLGAFCSDSLQETRICNTDICPGRGPVDCKWSGWSQWTTCTVSCGMGTKRRSRNVQVSPKNGGRLCQPLTSEEAVNCGKACGSAAVDCLWSVWTQWSRCSKSCGQGQTQRVRHIAREPQSGGIGCRGVFEDFRSCQVTSCSAGGQDCSFGMWSAWGACSAPCNGHHSRARVVASVAVDGGNPCAGPTLEITPCNVNADLCQSRDCKYTEWKMWSGCSRSCGGGMSQRKRSIFVDAKGSGKPCSGDLEIMKRCNTGPCPGKLVIDCKWSSWSSPSACTLSCGGGQQRRHRSVILEASGGGRPCDAGGSIEVIKCNTQPCVQHKFFCDWTSWGQWSQCARAGMSVSCGGGQRKRSRTTHLVKRVVKFQSSRRLQSVGMQDRSNVSLVQSASQGNTYIRKKVQQCQEIQDALEPCAQTKCDAPQAADCAWAPWSEWSSCPCDGIRERHRVIASYAVGTGAPCVGSEVQTKPCKSACNRTASLDCIYGTWSAWSACPVSCGKGFSQRLRTIVQYPTGIGKSCTVDPQGKRQRHACNDIACPVKQDCRWDDWSAYSACSVTCGSGQMSRARNVRQIGKNGGQLCDKKESMQVAACNTQPCPSNARDCLFSTWGEWHTCSVSCGIGTQLRTRMLMVDSTEGGLPCNGLLQSFRDCNLGRCIPKPAIACLWSIWSAWSACTSLCNGHRERNRAIQRFASNGGKTCDGAERAIAACNVDSPVCKAENPQDCVLGSWQMWTSCSKRCEGGQHFRTREVQVMARNFGRPCEGALQQAQACNTGPCPGQNRLNCLWDSWGQWSACTLSCNGGQKMRQRSIAVEPRRGGLPCAAQGSVELMPCNVQTCMDALEVCGWAQWSGWEECSQSCGGGQQQRIRLRQWLASGAARKRNGIGAEFGPTGVSLPGRRLAQPPVLGGPDDCTGSQKEIRPCGIGPCSIDGPVPVACRWAPWTPWGACSCVGFRERERHVAARPKNGGLVCVGPLRQTRACNPQCDQKTMDCSFGVWSEWSACSASCDGGQKYHSRTVNTHAAGYGVGCHGRLEEVAACNTMVCTAPRDCIYGDWAVWSVCSRSCGGGQRSHSRDVVQYPTRGGRPCDNADLMEIGGCGSASCTPWSPADCQWSVWSQWSTCSATCGQGRRFRSRNVAAMATHNGRPCTGLYEEYNDCKLPRCGKAPANCSFSTWSAWSQCFDPCSGNQERARHLRTFSAGSGGIPCAGALRQVRPCVGRGVAACSGQTSSADCQLGDWSLWSSCSKSCGGGQLFSNRRIVQQARGSGQPCDTDLKVTKACNTQACPGREAVNCRWSQWGPFSACSVSCGGGEMQRHRSIAKEAKNGGLSCPEGDTLQLLPCNMQSCYGPGLCTWAQWSSWLECSATCGPGQKKRQRDLIHQTADVRPALVAPSSLALVVRGGVAPQPDDPLTDFALKHGMAVCGFATLGALSLLMFLGHLLLPVVKRASSGTCVDKLPSWLPMLQSLRSRRSATHRRTSYAVLGTEDPDGGSASDEL